MQVWFRRSAKLSRSALLYPKSSFNHAIDRTTQAHLRSFASLVDGSLPLGYQSFHRNKAQQYFERYQRSMGTDSENLLEFEELPDPLNPHENPLATVGDEELSEDKRYWRKRQSEAPPSVYVRKVDDDGRAYAVGKRKSSVARVWLREGTGEVTVNGKHWVQYFPRADHREQVVRPLFLLGKARMFSIDCEVRGGGSTGQAEALRHGIARAMLNWNPQWRKPLKSEGLLTRDSRIVESKKYGHKKARKAFQWVKR